MAPLEFILEDCARSVRNFIAYPIAAVFIFTLGFQINNYLPFFVFKAERIASFGFEAETITAKQAFEQATLEIKLAKIENKYTIAKGQSTPQQFVDIMKRSKLGLSPFGMGELCYRDLELIQWGCLLIKPDMSKVITEPDFFKPMETYIPVKPDWSDLNETIEKVL